MSKNVIACTVVVILAVGLLLQHRALRDIRSELTDLKAAAASRPDVAVAAASPGWRANAEASEPASGTAPMDLRLAAVEDAVQQLTLASELLMERGHLPLSPAKTAELRRIFLDTSLPEAERIRALRVLRREKEVDDAVLRGGAEWLQTLSDPASIRSLLEELDGFNSPHLREPLLRFASAHADAAIRRQAIRNLESYVGDPAVDAVLWKALASEQDEGARRQAENSLRRGPMTEARVADLRQRALDGNASFREQFTAFQCLSSAKVADAQLTSAFAESVVARGRTDEMSALFRAFDNTGNLAAAPALVMGLQGESPELRLLALDALSEMQSDPAVLKWLKFVAENDADQRVRNEAARVLAQGANQGR